ncbi:MFS transporter [Streptococcus macacae]|uniref:Transporter, major facilitator family protein n=1 Tax=Streptococcus macacae NCTC 11558 TaxID=764298 RepID=G5JX04_9STRE|nr:MFS transporter [Streptococcus macacae]EHJ52489.1 transporter, major facilitator family protein [Streptococcus macacae NCTC 11558]SUN79480.1 macrolide-efflux protein [Streptococcus macacae NCTC 11558]
MIHQSRFKYFLVLWGGQLISSIGSGLTSFGLNVYVFEKTGSALACSLVTLCAFFPLVFFTPISGAIADKFSRGKLMLIGDFFSAVCLGGMFVMISMGINNIPAICIWVFLSSCFAAILDPAYKATVTDLLTSEEFSKAGGLVQLASSAKYLLSPIFAGLIYQISGIYLILVIDMCTFFTTFFTVTYSRKVMNECQQIKDSKVHIVKDIAEGYKELTQTKGVKILLLLSIIITFYVGIIETLIKPMLLELTDSSTLGMILSLSAVGMLISSLILGVKGIQKGYLKSLSLSFLVMGITIMIIGCLTNLMWLSVVAFLFFLTIPVSNVCLDVLMRCNISKDTQGRAWGLISFISQLGYIVAYAVSGALADYVFNPLLSKNGALANSVGKIVGTGSERGIALMLIICGISMIVLSPFLKSGKSLKQMEANCLNYDLED